MKRVEENNSSAIRTANARDARAAPLVVPHGGAEAGRDFESAFEMLKRDERARELRHRKRVTGALAVRHSPTQGNFSSNAWFIHDCAPRITRPRPV